MTCTQCGATVEDAGTYQVECPNGCWPLAVETQQAVDAGLAIGR